VEDIIFKTMKMFKIAADGEQGAYSVHGFLDRIIALERRSRALPKGSLARSDMKKELVGMLKDGLDEFGQRWVNQFKAPINYMESMLENFSDSSYFTMSYNKLDTAEDTAHRTYQFRKFLLKRPRQDISDSDSEGLRWR
jgi:hypothetical protein